MPQLDLSTYTSQIFWLIICFFGMFTVVSKFIIPRIAKTVNLRQNNINDNLNQASELKEKAEAAMTKYHKALDEATQSADKTLEKTRNEMQNFITQKQLELTQTLSQKIKENLEEINSQKTESINKIQKSSKEFAQEILVKLSIS